jgi:hypothetical protein
MTLSKKGYSVYEPSSSSSFQHNGQHQLNFSNSTLRIFKDTEFAKSDQERKEIVLKHVELCSNGKRLLFDKTFFGDHELEAVQ